MAIALNDVMEELPKEPIKGPLRKLRVKQAYVPSSDDPIIELKRLRQQHLAWTKKSTALQLMSGDRINRETGAVIPCDVPDEIRVQMQNIAKALTRAATQLESKMLRCLKQIPIWKEWLGTQF